MYQFWACELEYLRNYCDKVFTANREIVEKAAFEFAKGGAAPSILSTSGDTATISISGTLSKRKSALAAFFGFVSTSYSDILDAIAAVKADPSIKNVVLAIDSPGGNVAGLDEVWIELRALGEQKTIVAENRGMIASAAYWIASAASKIVATSPSAMTGSIGLQMVTYDFSEQDKKLGVKEVRIVSKNAPNKNPDPGSKTGRAIYQDQLDAIERVFISRISEGRGIPESDVISNFGQGALLIADDPNSSIISARSAGMIDDVRGGYKSRGAKKIDVISKPAISSSDKPSVSTLAKEPDMDIKELLKDPALKAEIDALVKDAFLHGAEETKKRIGPALAVLTSDKYPSEIKSIAAGVLSGEKEPAELKGVVAFYDAQVEAKKKAEAAAETAVTPPTPAEPPKITTPDGTVRSDEDHVEAVNRMRAAQGIPALK